MNIGIQRTRGQIFRGQLINHRSRVAGADHKADFILRSGGQVHIDLQGTDRTEHRTFGIRACTLLHHYWILRCAARADDRTEAGIPSVRLAINGKETVVPRKVDAFQVARCIHANKERLLFRQVFGNAVQLATIEILTIAIHRNIGE